MAVRFLQASGGTRSTPGTDYSLSYNSGSANSNKFLVAVVAAVRAGAGTCVPSAATFNGDSMTPQYTGSNGSFDWAVFTLLAPADDTNTLSVTIPNSNTCAVVQGATYAGVSQTDPIHVQDSDNKTSTSLTGLSISTTLPGRHVAGVAAWQNGNITGTAEGSMTERQERSSGTDTTDDVRGWCGDQTAASTGTYSDCVSISSSSKIGGALFALNPAPDGAAAIITGL